MKNTILFYFISTIIIFLIECTDMSDHNIDQPKNAKNNVVCILCMWALIHMRKLTVGLFAECK